MLSDHSRLKVVELRKNYGQSLALMAGIDNAEGAFIATMDGDLQNDPADIPEMLKLAIRRKLGYGRRGKSESKRRNDLT